MVPSITEELRNAGVAVVPMQSGSGMQNKVLEAMSCGLPVVLNSLGLGDIKVEDGQQVLLAESSEEFANQVMYVLREPEIGKDIGRRAREFVEEITIGPQAIQQFPKYMKLPSD